MSVCSQADRASLSISSVLGMLVFSVLAGGCGGGGSGGGVGVSAGQGPDPVIVDVPIAYIRRPVPVNDQGAVQPSDARELLTFDIGADLMVRDRAAPTADEVNVTASITDGLGDVRDLQPSFDGATLLFSMRAQFIEGADEEDQPTWNIWEYDFRDGGLRRVIASDITAESGHDRAAHYLPDGRIVFSSTRQRQSGAVLLDEGKPQFAALDEDFAEPAFVLHVMDADGSNIQQISFNQSHDFAPVIDDAGRIVFSRWDNAGSRNAIHLYRMGPDGSGLELLYGANSHDLGNAGTAIQFLHPRFMDDGQLLAVLRPFMASDLGGDLAIIDVENYIENTQANTSGSGVLAGPAQQPGTGNDVRLDVISPGGQYSSAYPLRDGTERMLVSWSPCRLLDGLAIVPCTPDLLSDPAALSAPPLYGIWVHDRADDTQLPVFAPQEGFIFTEVVAAEPRSLPPALLDSASSGSLDALLIAESAGIIDVRSVYDIDGVDTAVPSISAVADPALTLAPQRPARFLRIVKAVPIPDDNVLDFVGTAFGRSSAQGMREIIGYLPIEPDGSVRAKVPANVPLAISVLDASGRRITGRHQSWLQVRPGEVLACNGCHEAATGISHGRSDAFVSAYPGAVTTSQPFTNTESAIFADFGETMAQARGRLSCATDCESETPSVDIEFADIWTNEAAAGRPKDAPFALRYADLDTPAPVSQACIDSWSPLCRIIINYETHIHPLWDLPRPLLAADGVTVLEDRTCNTCHNGRDAMDVAQEPAGQLSLADGSDPLVIDHFVAYRELLFPDFEEQVDLVNNRLVDVQEFVGIDPDTGDSIFAPITLSPPVSTAGAIASARFFDPFDAGGSHDGYLTAAELRLLAEWVDIGAQYYNNPFDAPVN